MPKATLKNRLFMLFWDWRPQQNFVLWLTLQCSSDLPPWGEVAVRIILIPRLAFCPENSIQIYCVVFIWNWKASTKKANLVLWPLLSKKSLRNWKLKRTSGFSLSLFGRNGATKEFSLRFGHSKIRLDLIQAFSVRPNHLYDVYLVHFFCSSRSKLFLVVVIRRLRESSHRNQIKLSIDLILQRISFELSLTSMLIWFWYLVNLLAGFVNFLMCLRS